MSYVGVCVSIRSFSKLSQGVGNEGYLKTGILMCGWYRQPFRPELGVDGNRTRMSFSKPSLTRIAPRGFGAIE
jgi:hypothetical protein